MLKKVIFSLATLCFITETSYALPEYILAPVSSKISISAPAFKPLLLSSFPKKFVVNFSLAPSVTVNPLISDDLILLSLKYKKHF